MTATLPDVAAKKKAGEQSAEQQAAAELVRLAKEQGLSLTGPDGGGSRGYASPVKFLVLWRIELTLLSREMAAAISRMADYGRELEADGKVLSRYHVVGAHGGAWTYEVRSHEEFERLLARSPVFNFAHYDVYPLAEMGVAEAT